MKKCFRKLLLLVALTGAIALPFKTSASPSGEVEPNELHATTVPLFTGQYGTGNISSGADYDGWMLPDVHIDDFFCMMLSVNELSGGGDPVLSAFFDKEIDDTINSDFYNDDGGPPSNAFKDSLICGEKAKRTGSMFVRTDGFGSSTLMPYYLFQVVVSPNEVLSEVEPNDTPQTAMPIQSAAISATGGTDFDYYSFNAIAGEKIVVMIDQNPGRPTPAATFITSLAVLDSDGVTDITESVAGEHLIGPDTPNSARGYGILPAPHTGTFFVRITKSNIATSDGNAYRLVVLVDGATPTVGACCDLGTCSLRAAANCRGKFGGVGSVCGGDADADGFADGCDNCSSNTNADQADADADEVGDVCDTCATDKLKIIPGACGCGTKDTDTDGDNVADCNDQCPADSRESIPGACGCGVIENDANGNGIFDCLVGEDSKAILRKLLDDLKTQVTSLKTKKKPSKKVATALKDLLTQIQNVVHANGSQIGVKSGFDLNAGIANLSKALGTTLKSKAKKLKKSKGTTLTQTQAVLDAIA